MALDSYEKRKDRPREGLSDDGTRAVESFRGKLRKIGNPIQEKPEENPNTPRKWADVSKLLFQLNPEYAQICMDKLNKIDVSLSDAEKTDLIMQILAQYSPDTEIHCSSIKEIIEKEGGFTGMPGFEAFNGIDFTTFAEAMERHDIGKVGMPKSILDPASGMLYGANERKIKETHPVLGYLILKKLGFDINSQRLALTHHLRYKTDETGAIVLSGYPREEFTKFCGSNHLPLQLTPQDHIAAFTDVFTALIDKNHRRTNVHEMKHDQDEMGICMEALEKMSTKKSPDLFADVYYQQGEGKALFDAFSKAMIEITRQGGLNKAV